MGWYSKWFGSDYISLYSHRNAQEAEEQVRFLVDQLAPPAPLRVLDIACGFGRHLAALSALGHHAVGVDLSMPLLEESRRRYPDALPLARSDMRVLPFPGETFDLLCSFFTSFGYFETDPEHAALLREWCRVLRQKGILFLDYLNRDKVIATLEPETVVEEPTRIYRQDRWVSSDGRRICKKITIVDKNSGRREEYEESVRMYTAAELCKMLQESSFAVLNTFGDFNGSSFTVDSPRLLVMAQKGAA